MYVRKEVELESWPLRIPDSHRENKGYRLQVSYSVVWNSMAATLLECWEYAESVNTSDICDIICDLMS